MFSGGMRFKQCFRADVRERLGPGDTPRLCILRDHRFWQAGQPRGVDDTATALAIIAYIYNDVIRRGV